MKRALFLAAMAMAAPALAEVPPGGTRFAAIAWHDVVDARGDRADDAVTTQSLIETFDWLKAAGWTPVSVDRIAAAAAGGPPLPEKAVLLSFDDGYRSFYERVYPLLLAYQYPAVLALVTSWMDVPAGGQVDYGGRPIPREAFVSWDEVRQMQASGLVEIASHSHDLHRTVLSTPQGNTAPAARTWAFDPATGTREDDAAHRARIRADLERTRARIAAETGKAPRVLVWPFGRFSGPALAEADAAGFSFAFTLEPEMADATQPMALHRYYPTRDPSLGVLAWNLGFPPPRAQVVRLACADLAPLAAADAATEEALLGKMIEEIRVLGATGVVLDVGPGAPSEPLATAWFPTPLLPMSRDVFGRVARQLAVRAGVETYARLPLDRAAAAVGEAQLPAFAADIARAAPIDGLLLEGDTDAVAAPPATPPTLGDLRAAREATAGRAQRVFAGAAAADPRLRLLLAQPAAGPGPGVNRALLPPDAPVGAWLTPAHAARVVLTLPDGDPRVQQAAVREAQLEGATALALCPWKPGTASALSPAFSAATFPRRP